MSSGLRLRKTTLKQWLNFLHMFPGSLSAVVGLGGGKALDMAKYLAFLAQKPYYAVPTSLSNDELAAPLVDHSRPPFPYGGFWHMGGY